MSVTNDDRRPTGRNARLLWQLVGGLKVRFFHERSFRVTRGSIFANRFLLTVAKEHLGASPDATIRALWRRLRMPEEFVNFGGRFLPAAHFLHFGYEEKETSCLYKVYLEMGALTPQTGGSEPLLLHVAVKWDPDEPSRAALSRYYSYPGLTVPEMVGRLSRIYAQDDQWEPFGIAQGILQAGERRIIHGSIRYLEVTEDCSQRKSFDLNLYDAKLTMEELAPYFARMCQHYAIPAERFQALFGECGSTHVGHLAGGRHREGEDFFNVYYGVEERQGLGEDVFA